MTSPEIVALTRRILDTHHARMKRELPVLAEALREGDPEVRRRFAALRTVIEEHMGKEESTLFPTILARAEGETAHQVIDGMIVSMGSDHGLLRGLETDLRAVAAANRDLVSMLDDVVEHARVEDEELFPAVLALFHPEGVPAGLMEAFAEEARSKPPPKALGKRPTLRVTPTAAPRLRDTPGRLIRKFWGG